MSLRPLFAAATLPLALQACGGPVHADTPAPAPIVRPSATKEPSELPPSSAVMSPVPVQNVRNEVPQGVPAPNNDGPSEVAKQVAPRPPPLFDGQGSVTYEVFLEEMRRVADELAASPEVAVGYQRLLTDYRLTSEDVSVTSYSRVRLTFEAARDGGLWGIRWNVTDEMPWSDKIWAQWAARDWSGEHPETTAQAECDELSALFSILARDLGVQGFVGLFWPAWNHTVAVWEVTRKTAASPKGERVRILVPTSQIWLSREATLGTREMKTDRVVFP